MKRFIAIALLFSSFASFASCSSKNKYKVNEQEFWDAISMQNVQYLQCNCMGKNNEKIDMAPNISHTIHSDGSGWYEENYVQYKGGPMEEDDSYYELRRTNPEGQFKEGGYPDIDYVYPEKMGKQLVEQLGEASITYQQFEFANNVYCYSHVTLKFENKRFVWFDSRTGDGDVDTMEFTYQTKDIIMPEPGDK